MVIRRKDEIIFSNIKEAKTFWQRFMGLMGKKHLDEGEGLWFENCSSIHCFFMKMPIDVIYCDKSYRIVGIETVSPWKVGRFYKDARHVLEVRAGGAINLKAGDLLQLDR